MQNSKIEIPEAIKAVKCPECVKETHVIHIFREKESDAPDKNEGRSEL